jgi:hypothetical protein
MLDRLVPHAELPAERQRLGRGLRLDVVLIMNTRSGGVVASSETMRRLADLALSIRWTAVYAPDHTGFQAERATPRTRRELVIS